MSSSLFVETAMALTRLALTTARGDLVNVDVAPPRETNGGSGASRDSLDKGSHEKSGDSLSSRDRLGRGI